MQELGHLRASFSGEGALQHLGEAWPGARSPGSDLDPDTGLLCNLGKPLFPSGLQSPDLSAEPCSKASGCGLENMMCQSQDNKNVGYLCVYIYKLIL